ncbi:hypothetical protein [Rhizobium laguerreae]|uniref:hypothetical protein n=1 Tax=Rhizobium laguerreae TaxID=1076926 RepID=UPI0014421D00|nr:hypothetical protein [Rhizobium laguerreae]NKM30107.1 hypothetical protein [Rhizobium laguerreae]
MMSKANVDETTLAIETLLKVRRKQVSLLTEAVRYSDLDRLVQIQAAFETLEKVLADEERRLPSIYETQGIKSV